MSIKSQIVETLKNLLGHYNHEEVTTEQSFAKVYSENEIKISQREVGGKVEMIDGNGELSDAPDGEYEMEDGFKFTVKDGLIATIDGQDAEEDVPVEAAEEPVEEQPNEMEALKSKVSELEAAMQAMQQTIEELKGSSEMAASKDEVNNFSKQMEELNNTIKQLAKIPVEFSKTTTNNSVKDSKEEKLLALAKMLGRK